MIAVILAGGKGIRLKPLTVDKPKPMISINGLTVLEHQLAVLARYGIRDIYLLTGYMGEAIEGTLGDGQSFGVKIRYLQEAFPLGTAGPVKQLSDKIDGDFLLTYGDIIFNLKLTDFIDFHRKGGGVATLIVHPSDHPYDSHLLITDEESRVIQILPKPHDTAYHENIANAGIYLLSPDVFRYIPAEGPSDFMADVFPKMLARPEKLFVYRTSEYIKDMGTPSRLERVRTDFVSGKVDRFSKEYTRPAIFMDRDGTLTKYVDLLRRVEDLELFEFSSNAVGKINNSDYLGILVTNQSVVARNLCDMATLRRIHNRLETLLGRDGVYLDEIFFCPHHPDRGYTGENPDYKMDCDCRKPKIKMLERASSSHGLDLKASWFIGDSSTDIQTGLNAGMKTILVRTGIGGRDGKYPAVPDFVFNNLQEGVEFILERKKKLDATVMAIVGPMNTGKPLSVITIGGPARSGKSTFVKCLKECLEQGGIRVTVISLDSWLLGIDERIDSMTVRERYRYKEIEADIMTLLRGGEIRTRIYDAYSRSLSNGPSYILDREGCIIIEGVPALDIEGLRKMADLRIYCEVEEEERKKRFFSFYRWKGLSDDKIAHLYNKRMIDEMPLIEGSKGFADFKINDKGIEACGES